MPKGVEMIRNEAIAAIIAVDPVQDFPVMASSDVEILINKIYNDYEAELKALQQRSCSTCKHCTKVFSYTYQLCTKDKQYPFQIHNEELLYCNRYELKETK